jgi:diguanylate cyclase (GGDEF)-like protein
MGISADGSRSAVEDVNIRSFMTQDVVSVETDSPLTEVVAAMAASNSACAIVCEERKPVGVVSSTDLSGVLDSVLRGESAAEITAMDIMGYPAFAVSESDSMSDAMAMIQAHGFARVAVVDDKKELVGIVTLNDLLKAHASQLNRRRETLELLVAARTEELVKANEKLQKQSLQDGLMGIGNRRAMVDYLEEIHESARRFGAAYSVIMIDIDDFKVYNDTYGHVQADSVLRQIADTLSDTLRQVDKIFRYGGEELLVALPHTGIDGALGAAERYRASVEDLAIPQQETERGVLTISLGVTHCCLQGNLPAEWAHVVSQADRALYRSKRSGKNCVST